MTPQQFYETTGLANPYLAKKQPDRLLPKNLKGWNGDSGRLTKIIKTHKPDTIIEVGSYLGLSAVNFATAMKSYNPSGLVVCVDTWLGSEEHWHFALADFNNFADGTSAMYDQFVCNMIHAGVDDIVVPVPNVSTTASKLFQTRWNFKADFIYIDASHDEENVKQDIAAYLPLLTERGIMGGDDWTWPGVCAAVKSFNLPYVVYDNNFWVLGVSDENLFN